MALQAPNEWRAANGPFPTIPQPGTSICVDLFWKIVATLTLVALNGFFVAAEFAAVSARLSRLEAESSQRLLARLALRVKRQLDLYLSSCQLGVTLASLGLGAVTEPVVTAILA